MVAEKEVEEEERKDVHGGEPATRRVDANSDLNAPQVWRFIIVHFTSIHPIISMKVIHHPDCLLHNPLHEILSGRLVPYLESPSRIEYIKQALKEDGSFDLSDEVNNELDLKQYILEVHDSDYIEYLETAYDKWVEEGGETVSRFLFLTRLRAE